MFNRKLGLTIALFVILILTAAFEVIALFVILILTAAFEDVLPCSNYEITISHKWYTFTPAMKTVLSQDFPNDPEGVQVLFSSVR